MLLFSFPAHSFEELDNLNSLVADWGHTTEAWVEYMLTWRDLILEYEEHCVLYTDSQQGPVYEHFWHGRQWKIPKRYEEQSKQLAHLLGKKGQVILEVFDMMEEWVEKDMEANFYSTREIKVLFRKAEHLAFLLKGKINKEWRRLEESKTSVVPQPTAKKRKKRKLDTITQKKFKLLAQHKLKGYTRKESFKSFHKMYPEVTFPKFLLLIRRHNRHIKRTSSSQ